ncbi:MAG: hypothetical protein FWE98_03080 [Oscillospiraceae bacterium]|nr:hypothetical protein [Oscillospiraceae bacterium]
MKKQKTPVPKYAKEAPEARRKRVSSGVRFRPAVFEDRRRKLREKWKGKEEE